VSVNEPLPRLGSFYAAGGALPLGASPPPQAASARANGDIKIGFFCLNLLITLFMSTPVQTKIDH
jgi:hypothetical protein